MQLKTITLFNRKPGDRTQGSTWYPTVIEGCKLMIDRAALLAKYGPEASDKASLHIPYKKADTGLMVAGKAWVPPKQWEDPETSLTFASGNDFDFFWLGEWEGGIVSDSEYGDEGFYNYMNRTKDYVFSISSVAKYSVIPHFEILGN